MLRHAQTLLQEQWCRAGKVTNGQGRREPARALELSGGVGPKGGTVLPGL